GSAAPPTAASGGGAKPRNELEPFVRCYFHSDFSDDTQPEVSFLAACSELSVRHLLRKAEETDLNPEQKAEKVTMLKLARHFACERFESNRQKH
ncbi:hypothetical protein, partial [Endozoicomonas sp. SESOKO3]|uniref:hypothetical protein n=1 Tax=Endozoicomonas sp. SESOKO3 TaxID=2828744 RepID=UPI0021487495